MLRGKQGFATLDFDGIVEEEEEVPDDPSRKEPTSASGFLHQSLQSLNKKSSTLTWTMSWLTSLCLERKRTRSRYE